MEQGKLCDECANCWCFKQKRCEGRYHSVEGITNLLDDMKRGFPGDSKCAEQLVTVDDGCICLNYAYQYVVRPLSEFTKKEMAEFMAHLMGKTWYSIFLQRVFVRRVFALKGWSPTIELDTSRM